MNTSPHELVFVVEKHNWLEVQWESFQLIVEEKVYSLTSKLNRKAFKKIHIIVNQFFVFWEVKFVLD